MKKTLIAFAALAVSGASFAQSNVSLYGFIDMGFGRDIGNSSNTKLQLNPTTADTGGTRFGLRGSEDLGGGLKANFQFESGNMSGDTGADNIAFSRASWVGLSGGFGAIKIGRQVKQSGTANGDFSAAGYRGTSAETAVGMRYASNNNLGSSSRISSEISYTTPNLSGFVGRLGYVLPGETTANTSVVDLGLSYNNGPVGLALGYIKGTGKEANYGLHASYNFGPAKVLGSYNVVGKGFGAKAAVAASGSTAAVAAKTGTLAKETGFTLGLQAPIGATTVFAEFARNNDSKLTSFELGADYALSKRTALTVALNKTKDLSAGYYAGIRHTF